MKQYVKALILEQINRGQSLKKLIPHPLEYPELERLAETCSVIIDNNIHVLNFLLQEIELRRDDDVRDIFRDLRGCIREIESVENYGINILYSQTEEIGYLNKLVHKIHREINLPLVPPSVACISTGYYYYYNLTNVIFVPIGESDFLLHIPDFFHEIGHAVLCKRDDAKLKGVLKAYEEAMELIAIHYHTLFMNKKRETCPAEIPLLIRHIHHQWKSWIEEFFCDLFGLFTLGPAYAWSHLHLTLKKTDNIYKFSKFFPETHPSDESRMRMLKFGMELIGFKEEAALIISKWGTMPIALAAKPIPEYQYAYPDALMKEIASLFLKGMRESGFSIADKKKISESAVNDVVRLLNEAWDLFWKDPVNFRKWEEAKIQSLKASFGISLDAPSAAVSSNIVEGR